jgi:hypothetical protein
MPSATRPTVANKNFFIASLHLRRFLIHLKATDALATADKVVVELRLILNSVGMVVDLARIIRASNATLGF